MFIFALSLTRNSFLPDGSKKTLCYCEIPKRTEENGANQRPVFSLNATNTNPTLSYRKKNLKCCLCTNLLFHPPPFGTTWPIIVVISLSAHPYRHSDPITSSITDNQIFRHNDARQETSRCSHRRHSWHPCIHRKEEIVTRRFETSPESRCNPT
jgi:hypothetical protein